MSGHDDHGLPFDPRYLQPDAEFKAPDMLGTLEGWRCWRTPFKPKGYERPKLYSVSHTDYYWLPRQFARAECDRCGGEDTPGESCSCGFYSAKTLEHLMTMPYHHYDLEEGRDKGYVIVLGKLANWGKVIEGSQGWRSEKAYPVKLWLPFEAHHLIVPIRETYGVPVKLFNVLAAPEHVHPLYKPPNPHGKV